MKTIEEQAREYAADITTALMHCDGQTNSLDEIIERAVIHGAKATTHWIPIEDRNHRMPNDEELILLDEYGKVWTFSEFEAQKLFVIITHWLRLPPAPVPTKQPEPCTPIAIPPGK